MIASRLYEKRFLMLLRAATLLALACLTMKASAQDGSFVATLDRNKVGLGEQFQVTYSINGGNPNAIRNFRAPDFNKNFITLMGPSQQTSLQIINGKYSASVSYSYVLQPRNTGKYTIPAASIQVEGVEKKSNTVEIEVSVGPSRGQQQQQQQQQRQGHGQQAAQDVSLGDELFLRATIDKETAVIGEPIIVTYKVYTRVAVQNFSLKKQPRIVGFWSEEFPTSNQLDGTIESINGKQYKAYAIRRVALFPTQAGELEIDPLEIACVVRVRQRRQSSGDSFFDRFFDDPMFDSYTNVEKELKSQTLRISVKQLPPNAPESFRGAVGNFSMTASLDKASLKTNETATLRVKIEGKGNIKLLEPPAIAFPTDVDHFDPKMDEQVERAGGVVSGVKKFEYLLIPRYPGERTIPPVEFTYYDLNAKKYVTITSASFTLHVAKGKNEETYITSGQRSDVQYLTQDVGELRKPGASLRRVGDSEVNAVMMLVLYVIPLVAAFGLILYRKKYNREHADVVGWKMKRATKVSEKRLAHAKAFLDAGKSDEFYLEIARALWGYVQDRFAIPTADASRDVISARLQERRVAQETISQLDRAIELTEFARYSPTRSSVEEMRTLYDETRAALIAVEQGMKS